MSFREWSEYEAGCWCRKVDYYNMRIYKTDTSSDKQGYLWRLWGPVTFVPSQVTRLLKSGCVSTLSDAKSSCVRAMRKHAKRAGVQQ